MSLRQLRASWGRTALVIGGVASGVSLIVAIGLVNTSVLASFRRSIELAAGPAALEITLGVGEVGFDESVTTVAASDPGVQHAVPLVRGTVSLADQPGETLQLFGADLLAETELQRYPIKAADRDDVIRGLEDPSSVLITTRFAEEHGLRVGQKVALAAASGLKELTVRGLLETSGVAAVLGGRLAVMDLPAAQLLLGKIGKVDAIDIVLRDGADTEVVRKRLEASVPRFLSVQRPQQRGAHYDHIVSAFQALLTGLSTLSLIAGLFIIYNTTSTGAVRRAAVMGELRLLGAEESLLFRLLVIEAAILGALGSLLGMFGGIGLAHLLTGMVAESMGVIFQLRFPIDRLTLDPADQAVSLALGLGTAVFASYFAARRASRVEPLAMFRGELSAPEAPTYTGRLVASWAFLIVLVSLALAIQVQRKSYVWGNLASTLWYASYVVIAVPVVTWLANPLHRVLSRLFGMEGRFAVESLLRARTRTGITVAAVALMLALAILASTVATSFRKSVAAYFEEGFFAGDLIVSASSTEGGWLETPLPDRIVDELGALPGVRQLDSVRALFGQIYRGERIAILALSDGFLTPERLGARWYVEGDAAQAAAQLRAGEGVDVSENLAERFGLHVGDPLELETPTGALTLPIAGVIRDYVSDRGTIAMSRRLFVDRWKEPSVNRVHVFLDPSVSGDEMRRRIAAQLGSQHRLRVLSLQELIHYQAGAVDRAFAFTHAIQLLILTVTVAGLVDLLVAGIVERRRELSLWQVIGADRRSVGRSIIVESATVGALGALLGTAIGLFTAWIWLRFNFRYLLGFSLDYHLPVVATAWYLVLVMAVTISVGYWAARYATSQSVLDGLRTESAPNVR